MGIKIFATKGREIRENDFKEIELVIIVSTLLLLPSLSPENNNMLRDHEKTNTNMNCFLLHF